MSGNVHEEHWGMTCDTARWHEGTLGLMAGAVGLAGALIAACSSNSSTRRTTTTSTGSALPSGVLGAASASVGPASINRRRHLHADRRHRRRLRRHSVPGMQAYFELLNAKGGVNGHKFQLTYNLDDGSNPDHLHPAGPHPHPAGPRLRRAVVSTFFFSPNLFVQTNIPTFGYNVSGNWAGPANLFAAGGSTQNYNAGAPAVAYAIKHTRLEVGGRHQLRLGHHLLVRRLQRRRHQPVQRPASTSATPISTPSWAATSPRPSRRMQADGIDFVLSCMQGSDNITHGPEHPAVRAQRPPALVRRLRPAPAAASTTPHAGRLPQRQRQRSLPGAQRLPGSATRAMANYLAIMKKYEPKFSPRPGCPPGLAVGRTAGRRHQKAGGPAT